MDENGRNSLNMNLIPSAVVSANAKIDGCVFDTEVEVANVAVVVTKLLQSRSENVFRSLFNVGLPVE